MSTAIADAYFWPAITCTLLALTTYNIVERHRIFAAVAVLQDKQVASNRTISDGRAVLANLSGRRLVWPDSLRQETTAVLVSASEARAAVIEPLGRPTPRGYRIIAVLDSLTCQIPQNAVTRLLIDAQRSLTVPSVRLSAVVHADEPRTVRSYALSNSFTFPLWFDAGGDFVKKNALPAGPLVLVLDDDDRIVDALSPLFETTAMWRGSRASILNLLKAS